MLFALLEDEFAHEQTYIYSLFSLALGHTVLSEIIQRKHQEWCWLLPKWSSLTPLVIIAILLAVDHSENGILVWPSALERGIFALSSLLLAALWLRPVKGIDLSKEWMSFGVLPAWL